MTRSLVYSSPGLYEVIMAFLYGRHYWNRQVEIARLIPDGASVVDLCCGPGTLFSRHLRSRGISYCGIDINTGFINAVRRSGGHGIVASVDAMKQFPSADYCVMQASLYHFLPDPEPVIMKMLEAAQVAVVISEPIRNLATSEIPILSWLASRCTNPGSGQSPQRFNDESLQRTITPFRKCVLMQGLIAGGREALYVLDATATKQSEDTRS